MSNRDDDLLTDIAEGLVEASCIAAFIGSLIFLCLVHPLLLACACAALVGWAWWHTYRQHRKGRR